MDYMMMIRLMQAGHKVGPLSIGVVAIMAYIDKMATVGDSTHPKRVVLKGKVSLWTRN